MRDRSRTKDEPNEALHRIAARLRFGVNLKGRVWAARGARAR